MVNKRHAGRKRTISVDKEIRSDQRERNQEFQDKQSGLEDIHISPPEHLDHIGTHLWRTLVPELRKIGTIKQIDHVSLESFCSAYSSYRLAEQDIKENGIFIKNEDGSINRTKKNPAVAIMNDSIKTLKSLSADLGLTFDARSSQLVPTQSPSKQESSKTPLGKVEF